MKSAKQLVQSALKRFGYRIVHEDFFGNYGLHPFFRHVKQLGFAPRHIVDVGANHGVWTRAAIEYFPDALYTLVEPQDYLRKYVQDLVQEGYKIRWINAGVGDVPGRLPFAIAQRDDSCTFVFDQAAPNPPRQIMVDVLTLNQIVAANGTPVPDMVKIDAEGFDLKVLTGSSNLLGKTEIFLIEAGVYGARENALTEVIYRMAANDYRLLDITDLNHSPKFGNLWLCELAFLRNKSPLWNAISSYE